MAKQSVDQALHQVHLALIEGSNEDAKGAKLFPLFEALFPGKVKYQSEAAKSDIYIEGKLVVEIKTNDWLAGFYQALHYEKKGLTFTAVCVIQNNFLALWKLKEGNIPEEAIKLANAADAHLAPNKVGKMNAAPGKTSRALKQAIYKSASFSWAPTGELFPKDTVRHLGEWVLQLRNLEEERIRINRFKFIDCIEQMERFFPNDKMAAIHCFYAIVGTWDATSTANRDESGEYISVTSNKNHRTSEKVKVLPRFQDEFLRFIEERQIIVNQGTGLTTDYYFSRFDEVMSRIDPEYARQHGIFFTDYNLSKFAIWFVTTYYEKHLGDKYIVLDPAGGSGNLATSWKGHLKHKIVSELQSDLLKTIERRMRYDPDEVKQGYTIIPKTSLNEGLNFLDKRAEDYYEDIKQALRENNVVMDKPLAFLLNPPYKNNDQNAGELRERDAAYVIDPKIIELTGEDAAKERYLAFLGQILRIAQLNAAEIAGDPPLVMIFTPTSWLIPRPTYQNFRKEWDKYFKYERGFLITSNEFFEIPGRWPLAFTVWRYNIKPGGNKNVIDPRDYTFLKRSDLDFDWTVPSKQSIDLQLHKLVDKVKGVKMNARIPSIKDWAGQSMYDFKRDRTGAEQRSGAIVGGLPLADPRRDNSKTYGIPDSQYLGLMDNLTPVRVKQDSNFRLSNEPNRLWFRLDTSIADVNKTRSQNGPSDNRSYCAYDLATAQKILTWYSITKAVQGNNPLWSNQQDFWAPNIPNRMSARFFALSFAFVVAEASCVVTKFEKDNPVKGAPEIFLDNPLSPLNDESFLSTTLAPAIEASGIMCKHKAN